jgi:hypothetical protein
LIELFEYDLSLLLYHLQRIVVLMFLTISVRKRQMKNIRLFDILLLNVLMDYKLYKVKWIFLCVLIDQEQLLAAVLFIYQQESQPFGDQ